MWPGRDSITGGTVTSKLPRQCAVKQDGSPTVPIRRRGPQTARTFSSLTGRCRRTCRLNSRSRDATPPQKADPARPNALHRGKKRPPRNVHDRPSITFVSRDTAATAQVPETLATPAPAGTPAMPRNTVSHHDTFSFAAGAGDGFRGRRGGPDRSGRGLSLGGRGGCARGLRVQRLARSRRRAPAGASDFRGALGQSTRRGLAHAARRRRVPRIRAVGQVKNV